MGMAGSVVTVGGGVQCTYLVLQSSESSSIWLCLVQYFENSSFQISKELICDGHEYYLGDGQTTLNMKRRIIV